MKKLTSILLASLLAVTVFAGCGNTADGSSTESPATGTEQGESTAEPASESGTEPEPAAPTGDGTTVTVGATPTPHAEILEVVKPVYDAMGYTLEIMEFTDYIQPNVAVNDGQIAANYFQHEPYLTSFNEEQGTDLVSILGVHYEPLGIYPGKVSSLEELPDGAQIAVPNDTSNEARALLLLEVNGLIKLNPDAGLNATITDITENPKNLEIMEVEAAQLPRSLQDVDIAVINGNYAIQAGLNAATDALAKEEPDSLGGRSYINVLVVKAGDENRPELQALVEAFKDESVKAFIEEKYEGAVVCVL